MSPASRRRLFVVLAIHAIAYPARAQAPGDPPRPELPLPPQLEGPPVVDPAHRCAGSLDVHAVDAVTHLPVEGVVIVSGQGEVVATDASGHALVPRLCPGSQTVVIERSDYKTATTTVELAGHAAVEIELEPLGEVIVVKDRAPPPPDMRSTSVISGRDLERARGQSLGASLAQVAGVTELRAATGVAKPIIRGQFGRRLLMLVDEVRHRAQEWGLEHAPEIDPFIADRIRVVRGPGGVRYGSDAIGGVVLVDPPELRREPGVGGEAHLIGATNGRGATFGGRVQAVPASAPALSAQLEGSVKRLAAASAPTYALANTGLFEWSAGGTVGWRRPTSEYTASYRRYQARLGVCACLRIHSIDDFVAQAAAGEPVGADAFESDFAIARPRQEVVHDLAVARGRWERDRLGTLVATYAFQHNRRKELDVVRQSQQDIAQFDFQLMTHELAVTFDHNPKHLTDHWHVRGSAGLTGLVQRHAYGGLTLIPDFSAAGGGAFVTERLVGHDVELEAGARYDLLSRSASLARIDYQRLVRGGQLADGACGGDATDPVECDSTFHTFAASIGAMWRFRPGWTVKSDLSVASRAPNVDEQYLNGTAPSFPVLGLGKPDARPETTYATSLTVGYEGERVRFEASVFGNLIDDYLYFAPAVDDAGMPIYDVLVRGTFPRFTTRPVDATFYGADGAVTWSPVAAIELAAQAALVRAEQADGRYLVFIPSDRYRGQATYRAPTVGAFRASFASVSTTYVTRQRRFDLAADFVEPPARYVRLDAEIGTETAIAGTPVRFALQGANLTNARYRDYTSLTRYFADEPGWQLWLRTTVVFDSTKGTRP